MTLQTLAVLQAMLETPTEPHYGLAIAAAVAFPTGTIYPILARLERAGWVTSAFEDVDPSVAGRPRRRLYTLTGSGAAAARRALADGRQLITPSPSYGPDRLLPGGGLA
jgi:DNA-binding PadR family transcriptional regulator